MLTLHTARLKNGERIRTWRWKHSILRFCKLSGRRVTFMYDIRGYYLKLIHVSRIYGHLRAFRTLACSLLLFKAGLAVADLPWSRRSRMKFLSFLKLFTFASADILIFGLIVDLYQFFVFHVGFIWYKQPTFWRSDFSEGGFKTNLNPINYLRLAKRLQ